jgi:hypothetical protein
MGPQRMALPDRRSGARDVSALVGWALVAGREGDRLSLGHDLRRDWYRWSAGERVAAITTVVMAVAIPAALFLAAPPI